MTVDEVNQHICICNREGALHNTGKLLAVGVADQLRYEYPGHWIEFSPEGMCTDVMGHVLVIDIGSKSVKYNRTDALSLWAPKSKRFHILDKDGRFILIQYVLTGEQGLRWPYSVDVDRQDYVCMGECVMTRCVILPKYLQ